MSILTVDFGSTFTKVTAISSEKILGTAKAFTTIETDIQEGLDAALTSLNSEIGPREYTHKLAASSAGGGLKMVAVGLVPALTAKAAREAACSAGAKVVKTYAYELTPADEQEIYDINPDLILLSGGTDGGNKEIILHNAKRLAAMDRGFAVIIAGNKSAATDCADFLAKTGKVTVTCENVMPAFNQLNIMPAKNAIRALFMEKIIEAKGLGEAAKIMSAPIIPTPLAVFEGAHILSDSLGALMAVDVGGATTDVYSMASGYPTLANVTQKGLPEPFAKRSVEGDLGMRYSLDALVDAANIDSEELASFQVRCAADPSYIPIKNTPDKYLDEMLCGKAVDIATQRHAGYLERIFTPFGETYYQLGKDLSQVKYVVGLGGPIIYSDNPKAILQNTIQSGESLKPKTPKFLIDKRYIFAAMGLLSRVNKELALKILQNELTEV
ncbi:MAG: methylaspartate mutase accessory protein GlmL [Defluviitaleaceae bacterium]|nr:methylaspartate mutase accessory protein GlmL [Defluviitaleaceae bacterium]